MVRTAPVYLSLPEVSAMLHLSRARIYQLINDNKSNFPPAIKLGGNPNAKAGRVLWREGDIVAWIESHALRAAA